MEDIELVIKIPKEIYKASQIIDVKHEDVIQIPLEVIVNGTPLPKCHGRLIDMKKLQNLVSRYTEHDAVQLILADREDYIPTIIEADKAESENKE